VDVQLVREHTANQIQGKIEVFDALLRKGDRRISRNPAGFLVQSIRHNYSPPAGLGNKVSCFNAGQPARTKDHNERFLSAKIRIQFEVGDAESSVVTQYLSQLPASERAELEGKALLQAHGLPAEEYWRATMAGNTGLAQHYRDVIVKQHLRRTKPVALKTK
jgi:hypothetical protein